jgi:hypothetical protein
MATMALCGNRTTTTRLDEGMEMETMRGGDTDEDDG